MKMMTKKEINGLLMLALFTTSCMTLPQIALAQVTPNNGATQVYDAPNGVPVVDIAGANAAGLSHNKFNDYNVSSEGLVLNNGNASQISRNSALAGQVAANLNLTNEASVILNEVVMPNRSTLAGFTEVLGGAADVIVANPYGITCNGCGFINTSKAVLTTGAPQFGAGGAITGIRTEDGDILITGNGLNAENADYLALISRAVTINGQINAKDLDIVAGGSDYDYATKAATTRAAAGTPAPTLAIDSSALGGMYANRIRLIATESGVGVRMRGEAAANAGDFTIDSAGKVTLNSKISAKNDLKVQTSAVGAEAIKATDAQLLAERDVSVVASGETLLQGGTINGDRNVTISGGTLRDEKTATAAADNNKRYAGNTLFFESGTTATLDGVSYGAGSSLSGNMGSLTIGAQGATLYSNDTLTLLAGSLALNKAAVKSVNNMTLTATGGSITTQAGAGQGIQSTAGDVSLRTASLLDNAGTVAADAGDIRLGVAGTVTNTGTMNAKDGLYMVDYAGGATGILDNHGKMIGEKVVDIKAVSATNRSGAFIQSIESLLLSLSGAFSNSGTTILQDSTHTKAASITAASVTNNGMIYSGGDLNVNASTFITNNATGGLAAYRNLDANANGTHLDNYGDIYAGNLVDLYAANTLYNRATGAINSGRDMLLAAGIFTNQNDIFAARNIGITANSFYNEIEGGDTRTTTSGTKTTTNHGWSDGGAFGDQPEYLLPGEDSVRRYTQTWSDVQSYGTTPTSAMRAQLLAGNALTVSGFTYGLNLGSLMSAATVTLTGAGGAVFTNDAYGLTTVNYTKKWHDYAYCCDGFTVPITFNIQDGTTSSSTSTAGPGSGIYATTFSAAGLGLTNIASVLPPTVTPETGSGTSFGGISLTLPTNPNGFFVVNQNPNSTYLVETNPLFTDPNMLGSDYLAKRFGIDPEYTQRRLGDANYEAYLVRQQLIAQLGSNLIEQGDTEAAQMQKLMDNGADQGKALGLTYGKAPTEAQLANLQDDFVWMVETEVAGQKVLAPVVYLAAATKAKFELGGAVIAANTTNMDVDSLTNQGGTIIGSETLRVASRGNITNLSGSMRGGNVDLSSIEGSIINETHARTTGSDVHATTDIGKQAGIEATGNLKLDARKDIVNRGANMAAGGDASLKADENITFDTVRDTKATTTQEGHTTTIEASTTNIRSGLTVGGNLKTESGKNTTFAGADVDVAGDADVNAGGNISIVSRDDTKTTSTSSTKSGIGVGGGIWGVESEKTDSYQSRNKGTNFNVGGNAKLAADETLTIQGSEISSGGDMELKGKDVKIVEGRDVDSTKSSKTTTTFGKIDTDEGFEVEQDEAEEEGEERGGVSAKAEASAETGHKSSGGVTFNETDIVTTTHNKSTATGSSVKSGGNMKITADNDVLVRGSDVESGADVDVEAKNVTVTAAANTETTTTTRTNSKVGLYGGTDNSAGANASAEAYAAAEGSGAPAAGANIGAGASASTANTVDIVRVDATASTTTDVTHTGGSIKSGGNAKIKADEKLTVHGSSLESNGDMELDAKDMSFTAANDSHTETSSGSHTRAGLYADADASADAGANVDVEGMTGGAEAGVGAGANAGVGLYGSNTTQGLVSGSTTAQTSSIKSGGNLTRKATGNITDEGTQIEAGGDFTQEADSWDSKAAKSTTFTNSNRETNSARLGVYGEAAAEASAEADTMYKNDYEAGAGASAGVAASYNRDTSDTFSYGTEAVVSNIKSGGNLKSTTTGKASLEGTNLESGGDMELNAKTLDYKAARNTESETEGKTNANADMKIGVDATKAVSGSIGGGYGEENSNASSSTAVVGSMNSGGKLKVKTDGDANFEGVNIESADDASIDAGGDVNFNAARNTSNSSETSWNVAASLSATKSKSADGENSSGKGLEAEGGYATSTETSDEAVAGSIKSGGKLNVKSGKSATFEGTGIESAGDTTIEAEKDIAFNAAESTSSSSGWGVEASVSGSKGGSRGQNGKTRNRESEAEGGISGSYQESSERTSEVASIQSGGNLKLKSGNDINLEGTNIEADGSADLEAGNDVNFTAATNTSHSIGFSGGAEGIVTKEGADENGDGVAQQQEKKGKAGFELEGEDSTTKTGGSIKAKTIGVKAGNDVNLEGTKTDSKGDTTINAGGDVNLTAAESTHIGGGIGVGGGTRGAGLKRASIDAGVENQAVEMKSGNDLNITSGGKTTMEGTQVEAAGNANIDAQGGVVKKEVGSGGFDLGLDHAGAEGNVQGVNITEGGEDNSPTGDDSNALQAVFSQIAETGPDSVPPSEAQNDLMNEIENLDTDESLTPKQKEEKRATLEAKLENQKAIDFVKQDKNLSKTEKDKLLKELNAKQKELEGR